MREIRLLYVPILLIFLLVSPYYLSQNETKLDLLLDSATNCLKNENINCYELFRDAVQMSHGTKNDSIIGHTYFFICNAFTSGLDTANYKLEFAKEGLAFVRSKNLPFIKLKLYDQHKRAYKKANDAYNAQLYSDSTLYFAKSVKDTASICQTLCDIAFDLGNQGKLDEALKHLLEAKNIAETFGQAKVTNNVYATLATTYAKNEDYEQGILYALQAKNGYLSVGDSLPSMYSLTNWCNMMCELDRSSEVLDELQVAINYFSKYKPHLTMYPKAQLGKALNELQRMDEAIPVLEEALKEATYYGNTYQEAFLEILLSESYRASGNYPKALEFSSKAYEFHKDQDYSNEYLTTLLKHSQALIKNRKYEQAVFVLQDLLKAKDTVFSDNKMKEIALIQQELEFEKKENQICAQESEISLLQKEKEVITNRNVALLIGLILAAVIGFLLVKRKSILVKLKQVENENLTVELKSKRRELTSQALHIAQKNELLNQVKEDLTSIKKSGTTEGIGNVSNLIKFDKQIDNNWENFTMAFTETNTTFFKTLSHKHSEVSKSDLRLAALISMNLGSKEIASILNISDEGVKKARYRLRKKLSLEREDNLHHYLASI